MTQAQKKAVANYRRRLKRKGLSRLEVRVREEDAPLIRQVAEALADPKRVRSAREALQRAIQQKQTNFKEFLASGPLGDIDLEREQDFGRDVDL